MIYFLIIAGMLVAYVIIAKIFQRIFIGISEVDCFRIPLLDWDLEECEVAGWVFPLSIWVVIGIIIFNFFKGLIKEIKYEIKNRNTPMSKRIR